MASAIATVTTEGMEEEMSGLSAQIASAGEQRQYDIVGQCAAKLHGMRERVLAEATSVMVATGI